MISNIKKKNIQSFIQNIPDFDILEKNTWILEQHLTPPAIAADCLHKIYQVLYFILYTKFLMKKIEDVRDYKICDLGCGTGMIITGLFYMGAT